ncbi:MAG: hypothetical protein J2P48_04230 [Alphaproteobacteria bacterium]|nr:hypothetical protein [Alphaproteobacteria bacterium]
MSVSVPYKRRKPLMPCSEKRARRLPQCRRAVDRRPLTAAVVVNTRHWSLVNPLAQTELPIELSRDGRTKWNRRRSGLPKTHRPDAVCVGSLEAVPGRDVPVLQISCAGREAHRRTRLSGHRFPRGDLMRAGRVRGFQAGDIGRAIVPGGKKADVIIGRARMRTTGNFSVQTTGSVTRATGWRYCRVLLHAGDATAARNSKASASSPCPKAGVCTLSAR